MAMKLYEITRRGFLKGMVGAAAAAALPALAATDPWDQLKKGMSRDEVMALLGEPLNIKTTGGLTLLRYKYGFIRLWKGKVTDWTGSQKLDRNT